MSTDNLCGLLKAITIQAFGDLFDGDDELLNFIPTVKRAICTRSIVDKVQFEEFFTAESDREDKKDIVIEFKFSPSFLDVAYDNDLEVYTLKWQFCLPSPKDLPEHRKPKNIIDILENSEVFVDDEIDEDTMYDALKSLISIVS